MITDAPADTTMMRIVHDALRRDLRRALAVLTQEPPPRRRQRDAVAEQLVWMMAFLEEHHHTEDVALYPLVRERDPSSAALLDAMAADHRAIASAAHDVAAAAAADRLQDDPAILAGAVARLSDVLLPHLEHEETEAMPIVARTITNAEWSAIEHEHNLDGKPAAQLGREGHWLIDGATREDRARVLGLVPLVPRAALRCRYGPPYRRRAHACWGARRRVQHHGSTSVVVDVDIDAVWDVVRDPTRVGEWSHECIGGEWVGAATEAVPGARFRGLNRQGLIRWGRICEVVRAEAYELVWRTVPTRLYPDSTEWALRLSATGDGTRIEQSFRVVKGTALEPLYATILPAHQDRTEALQRDLERIGAVAAKTEP